MKLVVNDVKAAKSLQREVPEDKAAAFYGKKIGDRFEGGLVGLPGFKLEVTGGSDKDGFPMRPEVPGSARKKLILSNRPGLHVKRKGERRVKAVVGNTLSARTAQLNAKVVEYGAQPLAELGPWLAKEKKA
ncbi:MAG: 30S ribosomal protein S6e [Candidatus Micrarchaeota archaeon]